MNSIVAFETWRTELEAELTEAQQELASASDGLTAAQAALASAKAARLAVHSAMAGLAQPFPSSLARRLHPLDDELRRAEGAVVRARQDIQNAHYSIEDKERGLAELARLIAQTAPTGEPAEVTE